MFLIDKSQYSAQNALQCSALKLLRLAGVALMVILETSSWLIVHHFHQIYQKMIYQVVIVVVVVVLVVIVIVVVVVATSKPTSLQPNKCGSQQA